eukprot:NODE_411_length_7931_cov_0.531920.p3 type:complete len:368 gc:universal NODE_411_length_7931_cov_0.531920:136-1239(+)
MVRPIIIPTTSIDQTKLDAIKGRKLEISAISNRCASISEKRDSLLLFAIGMPGSGKTLAIHHAIQDLILKNYHTTFKFIGIDGLDQADEDQPWVQFWQDLTGSNEYDKASKKKVARWLASDQRPTLILFVDNSDALLSRFPHVGMALLRLATEYQNVILIASSVVATITDKLLKEGTIKENSFDKLVFQPYKPFELNDIILIYLEENYKFEAIENGYLVDDVEVTNDGLLTAATIVANRTGDPRELNNFMDELMRYAKKAHMPINSSFVERLSGEIFQPIKEQFLATLCEHNPVHRPILMRIMNNTIEEPAEMDHLLETASQTHLDLGLSKVDAFKFRPLIQLLIDFQILNEEKQKYQWAAGEHWCQ